MRETPSGAQKGGRSYLRDAEIVGHSVAGIAGCPTWAAPQVTSCMDRGESGVFLGWVEKWAPAQLSSAGGGKGHGMAVRESYGTASGPASNRRTAVWKARGVESL